MEVKSRGFDSTSCVASIRLLASRPALAARQAEEGNKNDDSPFGGSFRPHLPVDDKTFVAVFDIRVRFLLQVTIECLPEELLLHVLSLLPLEELVCRAARVCTHWRRLAFDDSLWAAAELRYTRDTQDEFVQVLREAPSLRYLDYSGYTCDMPEQVAAALCSGVRRVRELYLQTTNKIDGDVIRRILLHFKDHLETLTLFVNSNLATCTPKQQGGEGGEGSSTAAPAAQQSQDLEFLSVIGELDALQTLVLKGAWRCLAKHADVGLGCPALRRLDISGLSTDFFDEHECPFFVALLRHKRALLQAVSLNGCYIHPSLLVEVAKLQALKSITTPLATLHVIEHIESLEALHIQGVGRGDGVTIMHEVAAFMAGCERFAALRELVLEDLSDYSNFMAPALAASCASLETLVVCPGTWLDAHGLAELLRHLRSLRRLAVRGSTTLGLRHLQALPRHLPHLQMLDVRGCFRGQGVPPRVLRRLRRGLPRLRVRCDPYHRLSSGSVPDAGAHVFHAMQVAEDLSSTDPSSDEAEALCGEELGSQGERGD